jgi:hypothetical protein
MLPCVAPYFTNREMQDMTDDVLLTAELIEQNEIMIANYDLFMTELDADFSRIDFEIVVQDEIETFKNYDS